MRLTSSARARRSGKTTLAWLWLKMRSKEAGLPIVCAECEQPHTQPPPFGRCPCGSYLFGVKLATSAQPALDFHKEPDAS